MDRVPFAAPAIIPDGECRSDVCLGQDGKFLDVFEHDERATYAPPHNLQEAQQSVQDIGTQCNEQIQVSRTTASGFRLSYAAPSQDSWLDGSGRERTVSQAEGGEQGDHLMPLRFSIGIPGVLEDVSRSLESREHVCAFLDDVHVLFHPDRVVTLHGVLMEV